MNKITLSEIQFRKHCENYDGVCLECGEITDGGVEPDAEGYECESCGCNAVTGMENALIVGEIGILQGGI